MENNINFNYLYRDASNYKAWGSVIFSNPDHISLHSIQSTINKCFDFSEYFIAHQILIPEVFLYSHQNISIDDHCYHEFSSVVKTSKDSNDKYSRTISIFLAKIRLENTKGWKLFDPAYMDTFDVLN